MRAGAVKQEQQGLTMLLSSQKANVMDHVRSTRRAAEQHQGGGRGDGLRLGSMNDFAYAKIS